MQETYGEQQAQEEAQEQADAEAEAEETRSRGEMVLWVGE